MIMLALGANVTTVEPQSDFADAIADAAHLNCWSHRHRIINAFACERDDGARGKCMRSRRPWTAYRAGGGAPANLKERLRETRGRVIEEILLGPSGRWGTTRPHYDLLKLDGDGPEGGWLHKIASFVRTRRMSVGAVVVEGNNVETGTMRKFQALGFTIYRLDAGDGRRHMTPEGWDAFSPVRGVPLAELSLVRTPWAAKRSTDPAPMAARGGVDATAEAPPLATLAAAPRDALEQEMFGLRAMRHLWRVVDNATEAEWDVLLGPIRQKASRHGVAHQWLLTTEKNLAEPVLPPRSGRDRAVVNAFRLDFHSRATARASAVA